MSSPSANVCRVLRNISSSAADDGATKRRLSRGIASATDRALTHLAGGVSARINRWLGVGQQLLWRVAHRAQSNLAAQPEKTVHEKLRIRCRFVHSIIHPLGLTVPLDILV